MKKILVYIISLLFVGVLTYSFFIKWGKLEQVSFIFKTSSLNQGEQDLLSQKLRKKIQPYIGHWMWNLSIHKLKTIIQSDPKAGQVHILRKWPARYEVYLLSEEPSLILIGDKGFYPVSARGNLAAAISFDEIKDLPFLRGVFFIKDSKLRKKAVDLFLYLPKEGQFSQNNISEIKYSKKDQSFYFYLLEQGFPVRVRDSVSGFRPDRVNNVLKYLIHKKIKWRVIDARFAQKVIVNLSS